jgi:hypothetical protein
MNFGICLIRYLRLAISRGYMKDVMNTNTGALNHCWVKYISLNPFNRQIFKPLAIRRGPDYRSNPTANTNKLAGKCLSCETGGASN